MKKPLSIEGLAVGPHGGLKYNPAQFADTTFLNYAEKIASDFTDIIKNRVIPEMDVDQNLKLRDLKVLASIHFFEIPISPAQIADILRIDPATVSRAVQKLEETELLNREENGRDKRSVRLKLTDKGIATARAYTEAIQSLFEELETGLLYGLSDEEKTGFMTVMVKISRRAEAMKILANL